MTKLPFMLQVAELSAVTDGTPGRDALTNEDPLPAAIAIDAAGYALQHETRMTEVKTETTDDN